MTPLRAPILRCYLIIAGQIDRAIEWLEESIRRDANPMDLYFGTSGDRLLFRRPPGRMPWRTFQKMKAPWNINLAAAYARLGKLDEARASIAKLLKANPGWTLQKEAVWPTRKQPQFAEPLLEAYLADLAKAGLPEK